MKQLLLITLLSLLFHGCKSTTAIQNPEPHYEKYCVQVIELETQQPSDNFKNDQGMIDPQKLFSATDKKINPYPLVYLKVGETVTNDKQTTPLEVGNAISESPKGPVIKENNKEIIKLGKLVTATLSKTDQNENLNIAIKFHNRVYRGLDNSISVPTPEGEKYVSMPLFDYKGMGTNLITPASSEWVVLGAGGNDFFSYYLVRLIAPDSSNVPSIVGQQIRKK